MKYIHEVIDNEGNQIESFYSERVDERFSMKCMAKIKNGVYRIIDRETNQILTVGKL